MDHGFLGEAPQSTAAEGLFDVDVEELGYVMNATRLWAHQPEAMPALFDVLQMATDAGELSFRERAILVTACASSLGDSYCSLAWGRKLADRADPTTAAAVLVGTDSELTPAEHALAEWARGVVTDPNATTRSDVDGLRAAGFSDKKVFAATLYVALRLAFSTVNDALGSRPDAELVASVPPVVRDAVNYGRPAAD